MHWSVNKNKANINYDKADKYYMYMHNSDYTF